MITCTGYSMPSYFKQTGVLNEHHQVRNSAGLFDISHTGQLQLIGKDVLQFVDYLSVSNIHSVHDSESFYSVFLNNHAGITGHAMITKFPTGIFINIDSACREKLTKYLKYNCNHFNQRGKDVSIIDINHALLSVQGPKSLSVLQSFIPDISNLKYNKSAVFVLKSLGNAALTISRYGFTGEDGFTISIEDKYAIPLAEMILKHEDVKPVGLGARDSLRIESGLYTYGREITEDTSLKESGLDWLISKDKDPTSFVGGVESTKRQDSQQRVVRFYAMNGPSARRGTRLTQNRFEVGTVTSGSFSPIFSCPVGLAFVNKNALNLQNAILASTKSKDIEIKISELPILPHKTEYQY